MNKTKVTIGIVAVVVFIAGAIFSLTRNGATTPVVVTPTRPVSVELKNYTLADVVKHSTQADCWTTVDSKVYNLTPFVSSHPGGVEAIISLCGIDGTAAFTAQHGGKKRPANELASLLIGNLVK